MKRTELTETWRQNKPDEVAAALEREKALRRQTRERRRQRTLSGEQAQSHNRPAHRPVKEWTRKPNRILSDDEVREILSLRESEMAGALARKYGVRRSTISSIWKGRTHREITANVEAYKA